MKSRSGFSPCCDRYRFSFTPVSIPEGFSTESFGGQGNESIGIWSVDSDFGLRGAGMGEGRSGVKVRGEAESIKYLEGFRPLRGDQMQTGIGAIIEVKEVVWVAENERYPAENRYLGELETTAGERVFFISDILVPVKQNGWQAVGRLKKDRTILEISDHDQRKNESY